MRRLSWSAITLCVFLLAAVPAKATFNFTIENPSVNQEAGGVTTLSGWVYSTTTDNPVTVKAIVDDGAIELSPLCCGPRPDVKGGNPNIPLNTSFSLLVNYNELTPGDHQIVFEFSAAEETTLQTPARTITVVKPGARSGEAASSFRFLDELNTANANTAVDPDTGELIVAPVRAVNSEGGAERDATIRLGWKPNLQSFVTTSAAAGTEFAAVQQIFNSRCALSGCHLGPEPTTGLDLSAGNAFDKLVPIKSSEDDNRLRINPGDPNASYLYQKIIAGGDIAPGTSRMPQGCSGATCLSDGEIETIENWINNGAPPPQP
jgi:hypothetical protein